MSAPRLAGIGKGSEKIGKGVGSRFPLGVSGARCSSPAPAAEMLRLAEFRPISPEPGLFLRGAAGVTRGALGSYDASS